MFLTEFSQLLGNDPIKNYLMRMVQKQAVANSLLFAGPDGIGKSLFAYVLAATLIGVDSHQKHKLETGNHPDVHIYRPEGKLSLHSIQSMRQLSEEVHLPPFEAPWKVFIIHEADRMLSSSSNALLKTFEEPSARTVIILLSDLPSALLPTIPSRCRTLHFQRIANKDIQAYLKQRYSFDGKQIDSIVMQSQGSLGRAIRLAEQGDSPIRKLLLDLLSNGRLATYRDFSEKIREICEHVETSKKQAELATKKDLYAPHKDSLSAVQQHVLEKELEGVVTLRFFNDVHAVFDIILSWYRDIHLLQEKGDPLRMMNPDYEEILLKIMSEKKTHSLEYVQKVCEEALLSLKRSTNFTICLENLFLKLDLI